MPVRDRLAAVPRPWWVIGGAVALVIAVFLVVASGGGGSAAGTDATVASSSTAASASTTIGPPSTTVPIAEVTAPLSTTTSSIAPRVFDDRYGIVVDDDDPAVVARPIPGEPTDTAPPNTTAPPPWAASTRTTDAGYVGVDVGCATDLSAASLDTFFADRLGPLIGWDYQHVYPLGGDRYLWLFQDAFLDHAGVVNNLGKARFVHNAAMVQTGTCFTLMHRGTTAKPAPFEDGNGADDVRTKWYWPMGGELANGQLWMFWAEMVKDPYDPAPPDGLGWHPNSVYIAAYDPITLARLAFYPAPDPGVTPIYGYAVASDNSYTYLFGNTFEQNLAREGGFWSGVHSATQMYLARMPKGQIAGRAEYRTADGWSPNRVDAVPISSRFFAENPMQPRYLDGQWVAATKVDGYWGEELVIDVAPDPWGPWTTVERFTLQPRGNDPKKNSYHAHLLPWRDAFGSLLITVSNNARDMLADAWPRPDRYRPIVTYSPFHPTPVPTTTTTLPPANPTTLAPTTLAPTTTVATTLAPTTVATTTLAPTTTTLPPPTSTTSTSSTTSTTLLATTTTSTVAP